MMGYCKNGYIYLTSKHIYNILNMRNEFVIGTCRNAVPFFCYDIIIMKYTIIGETPAKKNSRITLPNGRTIPSKRFREWHKVAFAEMQSQEIPKTPIDKEVAITLLFVHGDKHRRDSDNGTTSILDLLVDVGVLKDDNWEIVKEIRVVNQYEKNSAKCHIYIDVL